MNKYLVEEFKGQTNFRLEESLRMVNLALEKTTETQLWQLPYDGGMRLGNQLLHITANLRQYVISGLGKKEDSRNRPLEFETKEGKTKKELVKALINTVQEAKEIINQTSQEELLEKYILQGFTLSGLGAVLHAVEHFSYHTGQIAFCVKQFTGEDLGFYAALDLNQKNS